jgi:hypothetical protein
MGANTGLGCTAISWTGRTGMLTTCIGGATMAGGGASWGRELDHYES